MDREHTFHAFAIRDLADSEAFHQPTAGAGDHHTFIGLKAFFFAFADLDPDLDGIAMGEFGDGAFCNERIELLFFELLDNVHFVFRSIFSKEPFLGPVLFGRRDVLIP